MNMNNEEKFYKLLFTYTKIDFLNNSGLELKPLLGGEIGLAPRDLLVLFFELEKEFSIKIPEGYIQDGSFQNIIGIKKCLGLLLKQKKEVNFSLHH